jgi:DNA-binding transcriptional LysR family regulator
MEIRQLRYFLSTMRRGSLKEAAREHFVTQPAISVQLRGLEEELGAKLYIRRGRKVIATQAGSILLAQIENVLPLIDRMKESIHGLTNLQRGVLRLGNIDAATIYVLPGVFRSYRRKYPGIDIQVVVADSDSLLASLDANTIELAIVTLPLRSDGIEVVPFFEEPMVLVAHPKHVLATKRHKALEVLEFVADSGLITYPAQSTTRQLIEAVFAENSLECRPAMEMSSPEAIKRLAEAGLGAAILPMKVVATELRRGTLKMIPTGRARFRRALGVVYRNEESLSPPARVFLKMLLDRHRAGGDLE